MRIIMQSLIAAGIASAFAVSAPVATNAQEVYFSGPGVGVEITTRPNRHRSWRYDRYYDGQPYAYQYYRGYGGRYSTYQRCPPNYTVQDGVCKPYRGY